MFNGKIPVARYREYAKQFNPVKYDPDEWVRLAKDAGMKYIVITSKHHDGFALFDSQASDWNVVKATPYGRDLLKPLGRGLPQARASSSASTTPRRRTGTTRRRRLRAATGTRRRTATWTTTFAVSPCRRCARS